jgi:cytochrome d ubiquinol oxidase subunit II
VRPELAELAVIFVGLSIYALLAGADFGAGIWEVNTALQASEKEHRLLFSAIGPVWEANHVWLIFVLVSLFAAFPLAFAGLFQALWLPLSFAMAGIVFRGAGFAFRSYMVGAAGQQFFWTAVFAVGSSAAPFFLGASIGALVSGKLAITSRGEFEGDYLTGWLTPLALFMGFFVVGMCCYLSAVYLAREAWRLGDRELIATWRARAIASGIWMGALALAGVTFVASDPVLWEGFRQRSWPLVVGSIAGGFSSLLALARYRFTLASLCSALAVTLVIAGWGAAQYPLLVPPSISLEMAKAPDNVLWVLLATTAAGAVFLLPALGYLLYLFKVQRSPR